MNSQEDNQNNSTNNQSPYSIALPSDSPASFDGFDFDNDSQTDKAHTTKVLIALFKA